MKSPETDEALDAMLRAEEQYIPDDGFTAQVVSSLPRRRRSGVRQAILLSAALVGFMMAAYWMPSLLAGVIVKQNGHWHFNLTQTALITMGGILLAVGSLFWGVFAAVKWED